MNPVVRGCDGARGAIAAGHPLAVGAGIELLAAGGTAADAAIGAQAVLCVVMPNACGLGGDTLLLVRAPGGGTTAAGGEVTAVGGAGGAAGTAPAATIDGGLSVTVPGIVRAWADVHERWGRLPLDRVLRPAVQVAEIGHRVGEALASATAHQTDRLRRRGAGAWADSFRDPDARVQHPALTAMLRAIGADGPDAFYRGALAEGIVAAVRRTGGSLALEDLAAHRSVVDEPVEIQWAGRSLWVQPPPSQGVLLALALQWLDRNAPPPRGKLDHVCVELTEAAFGVRDRAGRGAALLDVELEVDPERAGRRGGPRSYLHTTGVAAADASGLVLSSLLSVFDDFGSAVYVPEGGFVLNNRAACFTGPPNDFAPGKRPVHTLAPMLLDAAEGPLAIATPGADGQVQTLLQVVGGMRFGRMTLAEAIAAPRWRSEHSRLLIERSHPRRAALARLGHELVVVPDGDERMGAVVSAGIRRGLPVAAADWRRVATGGAV